MHRECRVCPPNTFPYEQIDKMGGGKDRVWTELWLIHGGQSKLDSEKGHGNFLLLQNKQGVRERL